MVWNAPKRILESATKKNLNQWPNTLTIVLSSYAANIVLTAITQKGDEQILISPAIAEMNGIFPIVREEDMEKLTPEKVYDIYREISISKEKLQKILERIKAVL